MVSPSLRAPSLDAPLGTVASERAVPGGSDARLPSVGAREYLELRRRVHAAGLFDRSYGYYLALVAALAAGLGLIGGLLALLPGPGDLLAAPLLALLLVQLGFLVHDAGHNQIFRSTRNNRRVGLLCAAGLLGVSFRNWVDKHNAHHGHCNEIDNDPDINHPLLAFTPEQAAQRRGWVRWVVRHQARLYFLLAMFATLSFRLDAWRHVLGEWRERRARWELAMIALNYVAWLLLPSLLLGVGRWLPLFVASQLLTGMYMASVFAPNHKGMPLIRGRRLSFMEQQVLTSRNVRGGTVTDALFGGLNYQIEHHLFPTVARNRLPALRAIVRPYCREVGLRYEELGVLPSYRLLLRQLEAVGRGIEPPAPAAAATLDAAR
jgi:fatty acid desaturase